MASFHMRTSGWSAANMSRRRWTNDLVRATIVPPTNRFSESVEVAAGQAIGGPPPRHAHSVWPFFRRREAFPDCFTKHLRQPGRVEAVRLESGRTGLLKA
jgi:hypothetical protein